MSQQRHQVIIIGAGIAGLRCAQVLHQKGIQTLIIEKESEAGGRIRTREKNGFLLDEGFQVLLDSYEEVRRAIPFAELHTKTFDSGALVAAGSGNLRYAFHPLRHPDRLFYTLFRFPGTLSDLLKMGWMALKYRHAHPDFWKNVQKETTATFIAGAHFSPSFYLGFLRPFFGGVFLDPNLGLPAAYFRWLLAKFFSGSACLPEKGMAALPALMAKTAGEIRLNTPVREINEGTILLENKEILETDWIVDARSFQDKGEKGNFRNTLTLYLEGPAQKDLPQSLILNADPFSPILHFCFPSAIQNSYAPPGKCLCSITLSSPLPPEEDAMAVMRSGLQAIYPKVNWEEFSLLETIEIPYALPAFPQGNSLAFRTEGRKLSIGDHCIYPSLNGALRSGREAAEWLIGKIGA